MVNRQLREHAQRVERRCLELGKHNPDHNNIEIKSGLDIFRHGVSSLFYIT